MKKLALLSATALTLACLGSQSLTAFAATENKIYTFPNGNRVIITYKSNCNIQDSTPETDTPTEEDNPCHTLFLPTAAPIFRDGC